MENTINMRIERLEKFGEHQDESNEVFFTDLLNSMEDLQWISEEREKRYALPLLDGSQQDRANDDSHVQEMWM